MNDTPPELIAWRVWQVGWHAREGGLRLVSLARPCIWDGPVLRADVPPARDNRAGIYAIKGCPRAVRRMWDCPLWVTGWVALSGRVVEHELGYRAERAVVRRLRLGVEAHRAALPVEAIRRFRSELEWRYQAPVKLGIVERRIAARVAEPHRWYGDVPVIDPECGWVYR